MMPEGPGEETVGTADAPPSLARLAEDSLLVAVWPNAVFGALARIPAPSYGAMIVNILLFSIVLFGVNALYFTTSFPTAMAGIGPLHMAASAAAGLALSILGSIFAAAVLHVLSRMLGGQGSFERSFQVISLCAVLAPFSGIVMFFSAQVPLLWPLPVLAGVYITVAGVIHLHGASRYASWAVFASLAAAVLALQWFGAEQLEKLSGRAKAMQAAAVQIRQMQGLTTMPDLSPEQARAIDRAASQLQELQKHLSTTATSAPRSRARGMLPVVVGDISAPGDENAAVQAPQESSAAEQPTAGRQDPEGASADQALLRMEEMFLPLVNNPAMLNSMPPEQAEPMKKLVNALQKQHDAKKSGRKLSPSEEDEIAGQMKDASQAMLKNLPMIMRQMSQGRQPQQEKK